jgi:acyl-coenzyme A synthetase/AMP-(fatty) acid ligase
MINPVPISKLLRSDRADDHPVALAADGMRCWGDFRNDVGTLAAQINKGAGKSWLLISDDAYALAVALLALLYTGRRAMLPSNLQGGHLVELAKSADGVLFHQVEGPATANGLAILADHSNRDTAVLTPPDPESCAIQLYTSGSTGQPEAIRKPLRCLEAEVEVLESVFGGGAARSVLATVPPFHIYGLLFRVLWPLAAGRAFAANVVQFPGELAPAAERQPAPLLVSSPAFLKRALPVLDLNRLDGLLHGVFSSGGPLPSEVAAAYNSKLRHKVVEVYGSTETGGIGYRTVTSERPLQPWTPLPGVRVGLSIDMSAITVDSPFLPGPGEFKTGDCGEILPDGRFALAGRTDRVIKLEERRISLVEIEDRLASCGEVSEARVLTLAATGERAQLGAAVVPSEQGWANLATEGKHAFRQILQAALTPHVEALAIPKKWRFLRRLPETTNGKITEGTLQTLFALGMGRITSPEVLEREVDGDNARIKMSLRPDLFYFDGHFDAMAILPGVVQVDWALSYAREHFHLDGRFHQIEALKFFKVLPASSEIELVLQFNPEKRNLAFNYRRGDTAHSIGRIKFGPSV